MFFQIDFVQNFVTPNKEFCCFGTRQAFALGFNIAFLFFSFFSFFFNLKGKLNKKTYNLYDILY